MYQPKEPAPTSMWLSNLTPMQACLSDHHVLIKGNTLFFNMMMQGQWNATKKRFNNGFGLVESRQAYLQRISKIVQILAELLAVNPQIKIIGLVEAPIKSKDIVHFLHSAAHFPSWRPFLQCTFPFTAMGIATFIHPELKPVYISSFEQQTQLKDRIQIFLIHGSTYKQRIINLHLPFDLAKSGQLPLLELAQNLLLRDDIPTLIMGDFNFHPKRIAAMTADIQCYCLEPSNLLLNANSKQQITHYVFDTVDGLLLKNMSKPTQVSFQKTSKVRWFGSHPKKEFGLLVTAFRTKAWVEKNEASKKKQADDEQPISSPYQLCQNTG